MREVRKDLFEAGDKITWINDHYANLTGGRKKYGDGPFTVLSAKEIPDTMMGETSTMSMRQAAGHTQHLHVDIPTPEGKDNTFWSGAFFKKVESQ